MTSINAQGLVNFSGLASGLDTASIVKAMVAAAHRPIDVLQAQQATLGAHNSIYTKVVSQMQALSTALQSLDSPQDFAAATASTNNANVVTAAAGTGAAVGSHQLEVEQLAAAQRNYSNGFTAGSSGEFGSGSLSIQVGSQPGVDLIVDGTTTLRDLATNINQQVEGVYATVITDSSGERLSVTGTATGDDNSISYSEQGTSLGLDDADNLVQAAQDSLVRIDGVSTASSDTNTVTDALPGITLQLQSESTDPVTLSVSADTSATEGQVQKVVDAYNAVMTTVNDAINFNDVVDPNRLVGDFALQGVVRDLQSSIGGAVLGTGSNLQSLAQVGIRTAQDGTLLFDTAVFNKALAADPTGMARLFDKDTRTNTQGAASRLEDVVTRYASVAGGMLTTVTQSITQQISQNTARIATLQSQLDVYEGTLQKQFNQLETIMSQLKAQGSYLDQLSKNKS